MHQSRAIFKRHFFGVLIDKGWQDKYYFRTKLGRFEVIFTSPKIKEGKRLYGKKKFKKSKKIQKSHHTTIIFDNNFCYIA